MIRAVTRKKDPTAAPPYLSHFRLQQAPFSANGGPAFFYANPEREQYLNMLLHLTQYSEELLLVSGPAGVGKTALLEKYLSRADEHWQICRVDGATGAVAEALFRRIAECFQLDLSKLPSDRLLPALSEHLGRLQQITPVLVIDDAHQLSDDALEIALRLALLEGEHGRLIRVTLFADPVLASRLAATRFTSIPEPHRLDLHALDEGETAGYLNHRLRAAGYKGTTPFAAKHVKRIQRASQGLPARINAEAHRVLQELSGTDRRRLTPMLLRAAIGVVASGLLVMLYGEQVVALFDGIASPEPAAEFPTPLAAAEPPRAERPILRSTEADASPAQQAVVVRQGDSLLVQCAPAPVATTPRPNPTEITAEQPVAVPSPMAVDARIDTPAAVRPHIERVEPERLPGDGTLQSIALFGSGFAPLGNVAVSWGEGARVLPADQVELYDPTTLRLRLNVGTAADRWSVQVTNANGERSNVAVFFVVPVTDPVQATFSEPAAGQTEAAAQAPSHEAPPAAAAVLEAESAGDEPLPQPEDATVSPAAAPDPVADPPSTPAESAPPPRPLVADAPDARPLSPLDEAWVGRQPSTHFTLQLLAATRRETLDAYLARHRPPAPLAIYTVIRGDKPLHILLQGSHASRAAAEAVAADLPQPWIRKLGTVQAELPTTTIAGAGAGGGAAWVWDRDPRHATIQLAAATTRAGVEDVVETDSLDPVAIVRSRRDGQSWFLLLYGDFPDDRAAQAAVDRLPVAVRAAGPWVRHFAELHRELEPATP